MPNPNELSPAIRIPLAGLLAWLVPGVGHLFIGERTRGLILLITVSLTFWGGIAIGGVRSTVDPQRNYLWFMAQICAGGHTLAAYGLGESSRSKHFKANVPDASYQRDKRVTQRLKSDLLSTANWRSAELALVYTGVAGLLNLLAILDAIVRADPAHRRMAVVTAAPGTGAT